MNSIRRLPTYFLSHGGGPWPWLDGPFRDSFSNLEAHLKKLPSEIGARPSAILVISGHWEEREFAVMTSPAPPMVYDYSGFPEHTYHIKYSAPGDPQLATRIQALLGQAGLPSHADPVRGFDHGTFAPLAVSYPEAKIPVVQLSLRSDYDPLVHFEAGRALAPLRDEGVLIIGSGLSYHNLTYFDQRAHRPSHEFDAWLRKVLLDSPLVSRPGELARWESAPSARFAHPQEDHLLPLMVAAGAAGGDQASLVYHEDDFMGGIAVSSFRFG